MAQVEYLMKNALLTILNRYKSKNSMEKFTKRIIGLLLLMGFLGSCNGGRHPQTWQPKSHKKVSSKAPAAYRKQAY